MRTQSSTPPVVSLPGRRGFLKGLAATAVAGGFAEAPAGAMAVSVGTGATLTARGELGARLALSGWRLTKGETPAYSMPFVLADVALAPPRRFNEFSGDLSGRYIGALASAPAGDAASLAAIVSGILSHQREDGRFGDASLAFTADAIGPPHMALLWGNGRLLVGLLEYHEAHADARVLEAARRLADFLVAVRRQCSDPAVASRLQGQGAVGFICFTQLIEGLVLTTRATGDRRYLDTSAEIAPLLGPRGVQHSHGYLSTLRGVLLLYEATKDPRWLDFVAARYSDLVSSPDYTVYGGVLEYFGWEAPGVSTTERQHLLDASGQHPRDEGCSEADFVRLSLQLWRATRDAAYLDRAELAILNGLYPNQWASGDFGSRVTFERGFMPSESTGRCWWCCTMHGHRAMADVLSSAIAVDDDGVRVTLLAEADWTRGAEHVRTAQRIAATGSVAWTITTAGLNPSRPILVRQPAWASDVVVSVGGAAVRAHLEGGFIRITPSPSGRASVDITIEPRVRVQTRRGGVQDVAALDRTPVEGALFYGPWLLAVDEAREPLFLAEPWPDNVVTLPSAPSAGAAPAEPDEAGRPALVVSATYEHGGFPGAQPVTLTPLGVLTRGSQRTAAVWIRYRRTG